MVADHAEPSVMIERASRNTFMIPGGTQALRRTELVTVVAPGGPRQACG